MINTAASGKQQFPFVEFMGIGIGTPPCRSERLAPEEPEYIPVVADSHFRADWPDGTPWRSEYPPKALRMPPAGDNGGQLLILGGYGLSCVYLFQDLVTLLQERLPGFGISVADIPGAGGHPRNMRAAEGDAIEDCISDTLGSVLKESNRDIIIVTFSTAGLFLRPALIKLQQDGFDIERIIGVSVISLPLGVRRPENEMLARVVDLVERYGPTRPIAHIGDFIWIKVSTRRPDSHTPPRLATIPHTAWYPLRATATIIAQGLKLRDSSLLPDSLRTIPQFVIHGARDGKCPSGPVWALVSRLISEGQTIRKLELPNSGHAIPLGKDITLFESEFLQWCETIVASRCAEGA